MPKRSGLIQTVSKEHPPSLPACPWGGEGSTVIPTPFQLVLPDPEVTTAQDEEPACTSSLATIFGKCAQPCTAHDGGGVEGKALPSVTTAIT